MQGNPETEQRRLQQEKQLPCCWPKPRPQGPSLSAGGDRWPLGNFGEGSRCHEPGGHRAPLGKGEGRAWGQGPPEEAGGGFASAEGTGCPAERHCRSLRGQAAFGG